VNSAVFPAQVSFLTWFDSRQLHRRKLVRAASSGQFSCASTSFT
jgi:hypothetical protein